jgi:hypothetical protein
LVTPSPKHLEAVVRLQANTDFKLFQEIIREYEREMTERTLAARDIVMVHQSQGGVEACRALEKIVATAPEVVRKLTGR